MQHLLYPLAVAIGVSVLIIAAATIWSRVKNRPMDWRLTLIGVSVAFFAIPYAVAKVHHYIESTRPARVDANVTLLDVGFLYSMPVEIEYPSALYIGKFGTISIRTVEAVEQADREDLSEVDFLDSWITSHFGQDNARLKSVMTRETFEDYYRHLTCSIDGPDYTIIRVSECKYLISPKIDGQTSIVLSLHQPGYAQAGSDAQRDLVWRGRSPKDDQAVPLTVAVDKPISSEVGTISEFLGVLSVVSSFLFGRKPE
jgi:hypothetical protein